MSKPEELKSIHSDNGYHYICEFIDKATRMSEQEMKNYKYIQYLLKRNPRVIEDYLMILKTEGEVKRKMSENLTKTNNIEFLLSKLTLKEQKIIAELVKGTAIADIPKKLNTTKSSFNIMMSSIYKKTNDIIFYSNRIKITSLMEYLFNNCGLKSGDILVLKENKKTKTALKKAKSVVEKLKASKKDLAGPESETEPVENIDQNISETEDTEAPICFDSGLLNNLLDNMKNDLNITYLNLCQQLGCYLIDNPDKDKNSFIFYSEICRIKNVIENIAKIYEMAK